MLKSITANTSDRLAWAIAWPVFFGLVIVGFLALGRLVFADYPWRETTDVGVRFQNGGLKFDLQPFIPLVRTFWMIVGVAVYYMTVRVLYAQFEKRFGLLRGSGRRSRATTTE